MIISVFVVNFPPSSSPQVFLFVCLFRSKGIFVARHFRHFFVTGFVKITLTTVFKITFTVLTFRVIVKKVLLKVLPQVRGGNDDRNGYLFISYEGIVRRRRFVCLSFAQYPRKKMRVRFTRDGTICAKNSTFGYFDGTNPLTGKGIQLRSPTPIMAPGNIHCTAQIALKRARS